MVARRGRCVWAALGGKRVRDRWVGWLGWLGYAEGSLGGARGARAHLRMAKGRPRQRCSVMEAPERTCTIEQNSRPAAKGSGVAHRQLNGHSEWRAVRYARDMEGAGLGHAGRRAVHGR